MNYELRIANSKAPKRRPLVTGFTLIEVIIVVVILGVMLAVALPSLSGVSQRNALRASTRDLVSLLKYARSEAVFNQRETVVYLDTVKQKYWLDLNEANQTPRLLEQKRDVGKNLWIAAIKTSAENIVKGTLISIVFNSDGSASPAQFTLTNNVGSKLTIEVLKSTGMAEVTPGTIEEKESAAAAENTPAGTVL